MRNTANGAQTTAPMPYPAASMPEAKPRRSGKKRMTVLIVAPG